MLLDAYKTTRTLTTDICRGLKTEDYVVQPHADVSPPKWHLGHTTWFFEVFILKTFVPGYKEFNADFDFVFNSYYESLGARVIRTDRGNLSRPGVDEIYKYREYVDSEMHVLLDTEYSSGKIAELVILGINHEQQHQELLCTDVKFILGHNPLFPSYPSFGSWGRLQEAGFTEIPEGIYEIGYQGKDFCFDNELGRHKVYLQSYSISRKLTTNAEYLEFIEAGGYSNFKYWHAEGWDWVNKSAVTAPLYWHYIDGTWFNYTSNGLLALDKDEPVKHVSYYEAWAFACWKEMRLPTEFEWETAAMRFKWGQRWEWTESAYLPYPGFKKTEGALGEYNGKFMLNQMVLRGASEVTSPGHSRITYRNFFHASQRWQYTGIRLAK